MKRDGEKRSSCLTVSSICGMRTQPLGRWIIPHLCPGLAHPRHPLQLTGPAPANTKWNAEMVGHVAEDLSQFPRLHTFRLLPTPTGGQHLQPQGVLGEGEEIGQTKGVEGCLVSQVPRPPGELDVSSCQVGTLFSLAGRALESSRPWQDLQASWEEHLITKSSSRAKSQ